MYLSRFNLAHGRQRRPREEVLFCVNVGHLRPPSHVLLQRENQQEFGRNQHAAREYLTLSWELLYKFDILLHSRCKTI